MSEVVRDAAPFSTVDGEAVVSERLPLRTCACVFLSRRRICLMVEYFLLKLPVASLFFSMPLSFIESQDLSGPCGPT